MAQSIPRSKRGQCSQCGKQVWKSASSADAQRCRDCRRSEHGSTYRYRRGCRCEECRAAHAHSWRKYAQGRIEDGRPLVRSVVQRTCLVCGTHFEARTDNVLRGGGKACSVACANVMRNHLRKPSPYRPEWMRLPKSKVRVRAERRAARAAAGTDGGGLVWVQGACIVCDVQYLSPGAASRYCSRECRSRNRQRNYGLTWLDRMALFARDNWTCQICLEPCDYAAEPGTNWYPTIDHVIPRSKGGSDDLENLRCAHLWCNSVRGDLSFYTDADLAPQEVRDGSEEVARCGAG